VPKSEQINELASALAKAQGEMDFATKDNTNPFFSASQGKGRYADLASIWGVCQKVLPKNGLAVVQTMNYANDRVVVITELLHTSGQWISGELSLRPVKDDPQAVGSAITYARRYSLAAIVGVVADDDDGEKAMSRDRQSEPPKPATQSKAATKDDPIDMAALEKVLWGMNDISAINAMLEKSMPRIMADKNKIPALDLFSARIRELEEVA